MSWILLNPGPVNLSDRVRQSMQKTDLCHREPEYFEMQQQVREMLLQVYGLDNEKWASVIMTGSGTAAMEAMLTSMVPLDGKVLVIENGVYGERLSMIAELHGIPLSRCRGAWESPIDEAALEQQLASDPQLTHLAVVQHETTTGRLNKLEGIAEICRRQQVKMLIDAVSSFGAEHIRFDDWPVAAVAASSNKCLHGIPGLAIVIVDRQATKTACQPPRSLYLDLFGYLDKQDALGTPFTPAVPAYYALHEALLELAEQGGYQARQRRYTELGEQFRLGVESLSIKPYIAARESSCVLRAYQLPASLSYDDLHDQLKQFGFVIYAGQGNLSDKLFRISTMGEICPGDIEKLLAAFRQILQ